MRELEVQIGHSGSSPNARKQALEALQESCFRLDTLFESSAKDIAVSIDAARRVAAFGPFSRHRNIFLTPAHSGGTFRADTDVRCEGCKGAGS